MYKAFLLTLCLLVCTTIVVAQGPDTRRPAPRPTGQQVSPATPILNKEQLDRLRPMIQRFLEKQRGGAQGTVPMPNQHPLTPPLAMGPLGGFPDLTPDPNLREYGPLGPNVEYGLMGPLGEEQGARQSSNGGHNLGIVWNIPEGFTHPLERLTLYLDEANRSTDALKQNSDEFKQSIKAATNEIIGALNKLPQLIEAANKPPMPRPADHTFTQPRSALAASVRSTGPLPSDDAPASKAIAASTRGRRSISPYNSPLPGSKKDRDGNRALKPGTKSINFAVEPNTELYDARGNPRGEIDDRSVHLNFGGERKIKTPGGKVETAYSAWFIDLDGEKASGLILEDNLKDKPKMPSLMPPRPPMQGVPCIR